MYSQYMQMVSGALSANSQTLQQMREAVASVPRESGQILRPGAVGMDSAAVDNTPQNSTPAGSNRLGSAVGSDRGGASEGASDTDNEMIQTRDRMVKEFVENNSDFRKIESV